MLCDFVQLNSSDKPVQADFKPTLQIYEDDKLERAETIHMEDMANKDKDI